MVNALFSNVFFKEQHLSKWLFVGLVLVAAALGGFVYDGYRDYKSNAQYSFLIETLAQKSGMDGQNDFHDKVDTVRTFVNRNTRHSIDAEFNAVWDRKFDHHSLFLGYLEGRQTYPPSYECSTRSALMADILKARGFKIRSVVAYRRDADVLESHTFLDVLNPEKGVWETQDPDYDIYWKDSKTGGRVDFLKSAVYPERVIPCNGKDCGWGVESREGLKAVHLVPHTDFVTHIYKDPEKRTTVYKEASLADKVLALPDGNRGTFCELIAKNCEDGFASATLTDAAP